MDRTVVSVRTVPNGYVLSVDDNDYMYFTLDRLLRGFLYHVGMGEFRPAGKGTIDDYVDAVMSLRDNAECVRRVLELESQVRSLEESLAVARSNIDYLREVRYDKRRKYGDTRR